MTLLTVAPPAPSSRACTAPPSRRPTRDSPFIQLGPDIFERILSHLCDESLPTSYISTDGVRLLLPFALVCTSHYHLFTSLIRRLSVLPLGFTDLRRTSTASAPLPFPACLSPTHIPTPPLPISTRPRSFPLAKVAPPALSRAVRLFPNLRSLHLSLSAIVTDAALADLARLLPGLRELRIPGNALITVEGISALAVRCIVLDTLDLSYCKRLADECGPVLRAMLSLTSLDVSYWKVSDAFIGLVASLPKLESLAVSSCARLSSDACREIGRHAIALRRLKFRCAPGIRDDGMRELAKCADLSDMDLSLSRNLTDEGVAMLGAPGSLPKLERVMLSQCRMLTDDGVRLLTRNGAIRCLDLSFCDLLTDECASALRRLPRLEEVDLSGCRNITDRTVETISEAPSLVRIRLTHCNKLTDESASAIATAHNAPLENVDVWKCYGISPLGLEILRVSCTKLRC